MTGQPPQSGGAIQFWTAEGLHLALGILAVTVAVLAEVPWWYGAALILGIAAIKETLVDPIPSFEDNKFLYQPWSWNCGFVDLCFYILGVGGGVLALILTHRPL
ncbi:MAG: hypothetical protein ACREB9_02675 [Thermoplasmata archaeon]